jgi:hypothetical protein
MLYLKIFDDTKGGFYELRYLKITMPPYLMLCCILKPPPQYIPYEMPLIQSGRPRPGKTFPGRRNLWRERPLAILMGPSAKFSKIILLGRRMLSKVTEESPISVGLTSLLRCDSLYRTGYPLSEPFLLFSLPHRQYVVFVTFIVILIPIVLVHPYQSVCGLFKREDFS